MRVTAGSPIVAFFEQTFINDYFDYFYQYRTDTGFKVLFTYTVATDEIIIVDFAYVIASTSATPTSGSISTNFAFRKSLDTQGIYVPFALHRVDWPGSVVSGQFIWYPNLVIGPGRTIYAVGYSDLSGVQVYHGAGIHFRRYKLKL